MKTKSELEQEMLREYKRGANPTLVVAIFAAFGGLVLSMLVVTLLWSVGKNLVELIKYWL